MTEMVNFHDDILTFGARYTASVNSMRDACIIAARIVKGGGRDELITYATETMHITKGTISKIISAGEILLNNEEIADKLPSDYTKVYELKGVKENIPAFIESLDTPLVDMSQRDIHKAVKGFYKPIETKEKKEKVNTWDALEDAIIDGVNAQGLLKLFYKLKQEVLHEK